ncbi:MAG: PEP-CTERM sorting domain-containing protein [Akkermansiaceae bacterium]|nr:PEP-CTERM sorting domain-containing protein [Akkermansiaceae bacterium]
MKTAILIIISVLATVPLYGQAVYDFHSVNGTESSADAALDGWTVADHYGTSNYQDYVGEVGLIFADQSSYSSISGTPRGAFRGDSGDTYANKLGLHAFCIDSETTFLGPETTSIQSYRPYTLAAAEQRFTDEGIVGYTPGGLKRAAYLLEQNFDQMLTGGNLGSATMQAAIWEVLTDTNLNLSLGQGNYYLRNNTGNSTYNQRANDMIALANTWFAAAKNDNWGGANHKPDNEVIFWLDPNDLMNNQSVMSLNIEGLGNTPVPEPSTSLLMAMGSLVLLRRRR